MDLAWLPERAGWAESLAQARSSTPQAAFPIFQTLAQSRMDFVRAGRLDKAIQRFIADADTTPPWPCLRVALLGSSTLSHLVPGIRLACLRRGLWAEIYEGSYGMYRQEIVDRSSPLHQFRPDVICLALDADHIASAKGTTAETALDQLRTCWRSIRESMGCAVLQQTVLPRLVPLMGNNEARYPASPAAIAERLNRDLRDAASADGVYLLAVDRWAAQEGLASWHDPGLWHTAKQEIHPRVSNLYGEQVGRMLAALRGLSRKCLVLDLDNTLWGGVIGDDGLEGILLGQGTPEGEAFLALQRFALQLSARGIILAVCSKNDEANALAPFESHPEMLLRRADIACFVANWQNKAHNLRQIADTLNIGLDALVFVDDNPAERALIRRELPMVAVPELPDDPAQYVASLVDAGYFEALDLTDEDRERTALYRANTQREDLRRATTDMQGFLEALNMRLTWNHFDLASLKRIVQLLNKTNQFNLTTQRYNEAEVFALLSDPTALTLQLRLADTYGDNGIIALLIGRIIARELHIETWLMSCRVLGREVERATLDILAACALELGCTSIHGTYVPSAKNRMVQHHFSNLDFNQVGSSDKDTTHWCLSLAAYVPASYPMEVQKGASWPTPISIAS